LPLTGAIDWGSENWDMAGLFTAAGIKPGSSDDVILAGHTTRNADCSNQLAIGHNWITARYRDEIAKRKHCDPALLYKAA
jgi:hypothetical protein